MSICTASEDAVVAAARAPADLLIAGPVLLRGDGDGDVGHRAPISSRIGRFDLGGGEGHALHLGDRPGVDQELGPHEPAQLAEVHLGHEHLRVAPQHLAEVARERVEVHEVHVGHLVTPAAHPLDGAVDGAPGASPSRARGARRPASPTTSTSGMSLAMPATLAARRCTIVSWFSGVVGDVAGAVLLLDAADAVLQARACRGWPTAGPASRDRAGRARTRGCRRRASWFGSVANGTEMSGSVSTSGSVHGSEPLAR